MKRILIGALVAAVIFFVYQAAMWMGGAHQNFYNYKANQQEVLNYLDEQFDADGLYMLPSVDPGSQNQMEQEQKLNEESIGKPWAMVFYHEKMEDMSANYMLMGFLYTLIAALMVSMVLYFGGFNSFGPRFLVSMAFAVFTLSQGVLDDMNWWSFPWSFIKPQVIDLVFGWGITSLWLAWFVRKTD